MPRSARCSSSRGAAKELARRVGGFVSEGDVDRQRMGALAVGELDKLALYRPYEPVSEDDVKALVAEVVPDSTWAILDAVAERRVDRAGPALDRLLDTTPEPVITVQLHRRLRELLIAADLTVAARPAGGHRQGDRRPSVPGPEARRAGARVDGRRSSRTRSRA